ncbi:hypothetical protein BCR39DRAFT_321316 [Naematelia encephala]|uniref:Uncharacterized protein n=1 Tax=Naematelia encephala TaxID=71784 RepID=A0A1Y2APJ2_9TREE|nr:hypothetical protein BCR39DRAFT_321316 [Naematelia encephala]
MSRGNQRHSGRTRRSRPYHFDSDDLDPSNWPTSHQERAALIPRGKASKREDPRCDRTQTLLPGAANWGREGTGSGCTSSDFLLLLLFLLLLFLLLLFLLLLLLRRHDCCPEDTAVYQLVRQIKITREG